jgi:flagellin
MFAQRMLNRTQSSQNEAMARLSSGLRINSAKDDAAGLSIATGMTSEIRGFAQSILNINEGISALQTADGALSSIVENLQRVRELAVQAANGTNSNANRSSISTEVKELIKEVDNVASTTNFNGRALFERGDLPKWVDEDRQFNVDQLYGNWLAESERMIEQQYGLKANGEESLTIKFSDDKVSKFAATVSYSTGDDDILSRATRQVLTIYDKSFPQGTAPHGGNAPVYSDRIIAHEMVHAVMGRTMDMDTLETWFKEGAAELIQGADESVFSSLVAEDGDSTNHFNAADRAAYAGDNTFFTNAGWDSSGKHYSQGYLAVRFLHEDIVAKGGEGIKDVMSFLSNEDNLEANKVPSLDMLDLAIKDLSTRGLTSFTDMANFKTLYNAGADAFIQTLNFSNEDTGAIGGFDVDDGEIKTATSVVDNSNTFLTLKPLEGYSTVEVSTGKVLNPLLANSFNLHAGAGSNNGINMEFFRVDSKVLGLNQIDIEADAPDAISVIDRALEYLSDKRSNIGGMTNRLFSAISINEKSKNMVSASRSRINDADFAIETSKLSKSQILQQASTAILAQANSSASSVLSLLG